MIRWLLISAFLSLPSSGPSATRGDPLEPLIEKTNLLQGFTARYRMKNREGAVTLTTLRYSAPDRGEVQSTGEWGKVRVWLIGGEILCDDEPEGHARKFSRVNIRELLAEAQSFVDVRLREAFPGPIEFSPHLLGAGVCFRWDWSAAKPGENPHLDISGDYWLQRNWLCGWLNSLARRSSSPRETKETLVWEFDEFEVEVSKATGFVTRAHSLDPQSKGDLTLESLDLEPPSDDQSFALPEATPKGAIDCSAEMRMEMRRRILMSTRTRVWTKLSKWIDDEDLTWDESSPEKLTRVFRDLESAQFAESMKGYLQSMRDSLDAWAESLAGKVRELEPGDRVGLVELRGERDRAFDDLKTQYETRMQAYAEKLPPPPSIPAGMRMADVFLECERNATRAEYKSQVIDPLLARFRERTDAVLKR